MPELLHTRKIALSKVIPQKKEEVCIEAKYLYQQHSMFLSWQIQKDLGKFYGWDRKYCLQQAHLKAKGKAVNKEVEELCQRADQLIRALSPVAVSERWTKKELWREAYKRAWQAMRTHWRFRQFDPNPAVAKAVRARLKTFRRSNQYFIDTEIKNRRLIKR